MKYYDFVSYGWCHIEGDPLRLMSNAFLYTTARESIQLCHHILLCILTIISVYILSSLFKGFFCFYNHLITLIPWFAFNIIYITSFIIENRQC